jgi:hypothetical protein
MPQRGKNVSLTFPFKGVVELGPYENQPAGSTPLAQNVRGFAWVGATADRGRFSGGQRAGFNAYHATNKKFSVGVPVGLSIQDINHISGYEIDPVVGTDHWLLNKNTSSGSPTNVRSFKGTGTPTEKDVQSFPNFHAVLAGEFGRDSVAWVVARETSTKKIILFKCGYDTTDVDWDNDLNIELFTDGDLLATCHGVVPYGDYVFVWLRLGDSTERLYKIKDGTTLTKEDDFFPTDGKLDDVDDGQAVGDRGWDVVGADEGDRLMAISRGTICMLTRKDENIKAFLKLAETGETTVIATVDAGAASTTPTVYGAVADKRGDFWVVGTTKGTGSRTGLWRVEQDGTVTESIGATDLTDTQATNRAPKSIAYDPKNDRVFITGKNYVANIGSEANFTAVNCNKSTLDFLSDNIDDANDRIKDLEVRPFNSGDKVKFSSTGALPKLVSGSISEATTYYAVNFTTASGQLTLQVSTDSGGVSPLNFDTGSATDAVFTLTRAAGEQARKDDAVNGEAIEIRPFALDVTWDVCRNRTNGGAFVARGNASDTVAALTSAEIDDNAEGSTKYSVTAESGIHPFIKMGVDAVENLDALGRRSSRSVLLLAVAGGTPKRVTSSGYEEITNASYSMSSEVPVIFSEPFTPKLGSGRIYYVDGLNGYYYDSSIQDTGKLGIIKDWKTDNYTTEEIQRRGLTNVVTGESKGVFPKDSEGNGPRLMTVWNHRMFLAGFRGDPHAYFMSRRDDPHDFDTRVIPADDQIAGSGFELPAGMVPDNINALIPFNDDILLFGCDHSIYQMSGDPAMGAAIDSLSDVTGIAWGRAWCRDPFGVVYFFGNRGGLYKLVPNSPPVKVSDGKIDERLAKVDLSKKIIRLVWNDRENGVNIFMSNTDYTSQAEHYFYDARMGAMYIDKHDAKEGNVYVHDFLSAHVVDGDSPSDRQTLVGGRDGRIYTIDPTEPDDIRNPTVSGDDTAIDSFVWFGPFNTNSSGKVVLSEISAILAEDSNNVYYEVYVGTTSEEIVAGTTAEQAKLKRFSGTFTTGRKMLSAGATDRRKAVSHEVMIKIGNSTLSERWAIEKIMLRIRAIGGSVGRKSEEGGLS